MSALSVSPDVWVATAAFLALPDWTALLRSCRFFARIGRDERHGPHRPRGPVRSFSQRL